MQDKTKHKIIIDMSFLKDIAANKQGIVEYAQRNSDVIPFCMVLLKFKNIFLLILLFISI